MRSPTYAHVGLGIHFVRGTWSQDAPSVQKVIMYDRLQSRFCPALGVSFATSPAPA